MAGFDLVFETHSVFVHCTHGVIQYSAETTCSLSVRLSVCVSASASERAMQAIQDETRDCSLAF